MNNTDVCYHVICQVFLATYHNCARTNLTCAWCDKLYVQPKKVMSSAWNQRLVLDFYSPSVSSPIPCLKCPFPSSKWACSVWTIRHVMKQRESVRLPRRCQLPIPQNCEVRHDIFIVSVTSYSSVPWTQCQILNVPSPSFKKGGHHTVILSVCAVQMPFLSITLIFMCTCVYVRGGAHTHDVAHGMCMHPRMFVCVGVGGWGSIY